MLDFDPTDPVEYIKELAAYPEKFMRDTEDFMEAHPPCEAGWLVKVYPPDNAPFFISRVTEVAFDRPNLRHIVTILVFEGNEIQSRMYTTARFRFVRHVGFCAVAI